MPNIRLNKFLSQCGVSSRRGADKLILSGKVAIGSEVVKDLGVKIDPERDDVFVNNEKIEYGGQYVYYILNKPKGYISTLSDPRGRKKVVDLVPKHPKVKPVGRLDYDSRGLIILTNDGDFSYKATHPKFEKSKEYIVSARAETKGMMGEVLKDRFIKGIGLKEGIAKADKIKILEEKNGIIRFSIIIHQGWNRQIRRMCQTVGLEVMDLQRVGFGRLTLRGIKEGEYKKIDEKEIKRIF